MNYTTRNRFTLRLAAAITGDNPWACGYTEQHGTARQLLAGLPRWKREHGGNTVGWLYHRGNLISKDAEASLRDVVDYYATR